MIIKKRNLPFLISFVSLLILIFIYIFFSVGFSKNLIQRDFFYPIIVSFFLIGYISIINLYEDLIKRPFSLNAIFWIFNLFFFFLSPLTSYLVNDFPLSKGTFGVNFSAPVLILTVNISILVWSTIYMITYHTYKPGRFYFFKFLKKRSLKVINYINIKTAIIVSIIIGIILFYWLGLSSFITRGVFEEVTKQKIQSRPLLLIMRQFLRTIPAISLASVFIISVKKVFLKKTFWYVMIGILGVITLILSNPLGAARSWVATIYLGYFTILFFRKRKNGAAFLLTMIIGLFVIFSAINIGRRLYVEASWGEKSFKFDPMEPRDLMVEGGFDAYENFGHTIEISKIRGMKYGRQLMGSLLFFVPRSIWHSKPIGSGAEVGNYLVHNYGLGFNNVSCPLIAEGYINFGFLGILLFSFILGRIVAALDLLYYQTAKKSKSFVIYQLLYPFLLGFFFFMLRGDLMSSFAYILAMVFAFGVFFIKMPKCLLIDSKNR